MLCLVDGIIVRERKIEGQNTQIITGVTPLAEVFQSFREDLSLATAQTGAQRSMVGCLIACLKSQMITGIVAHETECGVVGPTY